MGGIERVVETLIPLIPLIRLPDLKAVLKNENEAAASQRLGFVFEIADKPELADVVHDSLPARLVLIPLSSSKPADTIGQGAQRWRILINAKVLEEI